MGLTIEPDSLVGCVYGANAVQEQYYCNFGINPQYVVEFQRGPLRIVGHDAEGEVRVVELPGHPYFVGTLYVPQCRSTPDEPHPLVATFVRSVQCGRYQLSVLARARPERPEDRDAIRHLHRAAFPSSVEAELVDRLRATGDLAVSIVLESNGRVVGHAAFSPVSIPHEPTARGVGLAPVAILPDVQRQGLGMALIQAGIAACSARGERFVVVVGEPGYYRRFGFRPASTFGLLDEFGAKAAFQVLTLRRQAISGKGGLLRYASAFA
jgi:putative acetyltransferase